MAAALALPLGGGALRAAEDNPAGPAGRSSAPAAAAAPAPDTPRAPQRIGVLDLERIARTSEYVKSRVADAEKEARDLEARIQLKVQELRRAQETLDRQKSVLTQEQITARTEELRQRRDEIEELQFQGRRMLRDTETEVIEPVLLEVLEAAQGYAEQERYDVVVRADMVIFVSNRADITDAVVKLLDSRLGEGKPAAPAEATAPAETAAPQP